MPNCDKCGELKEELSNRELKGVEVDAGEDEGVTEIRSIYPKIRDRIKRMDSGSLPFPTLLLMDDDGEIHHIVHSVDDLKERLG